jgi:hypothetical protein
MAAIVYVGGAIGMEMIGGILAEQSHFMGTYTDQSRASPAYLMAATLEEVLEMTGMALFAHALLLRLKSWGVSFAIEFAPTPAAQPLFQHQPGDVETRGLA